MKKRKPEEGEEEYLFKVTLSDWSSRVRGMPYRILAIPFTLYDLAESITGAFDFDFDHAFGFYDNIKSWTDLVERYHLLLLFTWKGSSHRLPKRLIT